MKTNIRLYYEFTCSILLQVKNNVLFFSVTHLAYPIIKNNLSLPPPPPIKKKKVLDLR